MTVIATDGRTVAADGRQMAGDEITFDDAVKLRRHDDGRIFGYAGVSAAFDAAIKWYLSGCDPTATPKVDVWQLVVFGPGAKIEYFAHNTPYPNTNYILPQAWGSGAEIALGVMLNKGSPEEAVRLASQRLGSCGGTITVMDIANEVAPALLQAAE